MFLRLRYLSVSVAIASLSLVILPDNLKPAFSQKDQEAAKQILRLPQRGVVDSGRGGLGNPTAGGARSDSDASHQTPGSSPANSGNSLAVLQQQLAQAQAANARARSVHILQEIGDYYRQSNQFAQAQTAYEEALQLYQEIGDRTGEADILNSLGNLYAEVGESNVVAPEDFVITDRGVFSQRSILGIGGSRSEALSILPQQNSEPVTAAENRTEGEQPAIIPALSYEQALENYQQALSIYRETGDSYKQADVLNSIGSVYLETGNYDQSMAHFQQALALFQQQTASMSILNGRGNRRGERFDRIADIIGGQIDDIIGGVIGGVGGVGETLRSLRASQANSTSQKLALGTATVLNNIGEIHRYRGSYTQALEAYEAALETFQQLNTPEGTAAVLNNLGLIHDELGQYETALTFYQQSLTLRERYNLPRRAISLHNIGFAYDQLQQDDRALTYYQQALALQQQNNDLVGIAITRNNLGLLLSDRGQHHLALQELNTALALFQQLGNRPSIGNTLDSIATVYKNQQQFDQAETYYRRAIATLKATENRTTLGIVLTNLGDLYERMGQLDKAVATYQEAIDSVFETILADLQGEELRSLFADKHADAYARLINLLWNQRRYEEAFNYVERARARSFLSQIVSGPVNLRAGAAADLLQQEKQLRTAIETLNGQIQSLNRHARTSEEMDAIARLRSTLTTREQEYADLLGKLQRQNPAAADLLSVTPATLPEIQQLIAPDTVLVEYFVMDDRTLVFLVSRDRPLIPITLNVSRQALSEAINTLYEYDFAALDNPHPQSLQRLYTWLIKPLRSYLPSGSRLQIIPHNLLHYVPFAALTDGDRYLIDDFAIASLPSANVMRFLKEPSIAGRFPLLSLGNSTFDLPSSKEEVQQISTLYNTQPLLGDRASESAVWREAGQSTILHLATHGEYNPISPLFSTLFLAPSNGYDGQLQTHEIYGLDLTQSTRLVVLSACQAQFGNLSRGDEIIGLSRAFMYAGTPKVIASLWSVDDQATRILMEDFYTNLRQTSDEAESLQKAQQSTRNMYPHPYYWASFVMNGLPY